MNPKKPFLLKLLEKHVQYQYMNLTAQLRNSGPKTYSLNRCSKLPMAGGIEPVIILQDKSLVHIFLCYIQHSMTLIRKKRKLNKAYKVSKLLILDSSIGIGPLRKFAERFLYIHKKEDKHITEQRSRSLRNKIHSNHYQHNISIKTNLYLQICHAFKFP